MNFKPLNNKGMSILVIILIVAVISGIAGAVYLLTLNKSMPSTPENKTVINIENKDNDSSELKCDEDEDVYGCELFKRFNKIRLDKGLSPVEYDSNLCFIAKDMANNINISKDSKIKLSNFYMDKKYDKYNGGRDGEDALKDWVYIDYNFINYSIRKDLADSFKRVVVQEIGLENNQIGNPYDRGCFRFSENENNQITLVTVLGRRK